jgi:cytochrome c oxidase subunit II
MPLETRKQRRSIWSGPRYPVSRPWIESRALRSQTTLSPRRRRAGLITFAMGVALVASLTFAPSALAGFFTPKAGGSPNANEIDSLYKLVLYIATFVFVIVVGALVYSVYKFRAKKGAIAAQIHGNTRLEVGWTVAAALILVVLTIVTFVKLPSIINPPNSNAGIVLSAATTEPTPPNGHKLTICVQGRQYVWRYTYGNGCVNAAFAAKLPYSYQEMYVPAGVTVVLAIQSTDVIHSWWVPSLGGKVDAVPGYTTYTWFKALRANELYNGQCAQLCGRSHAAMTALVNVLTPAEFQSWLARQKQQIQTANQQVSQLCQTLITEGQLQRGNC